VQLLASPKPSPNAFTEPIDRSMFDSLLQIVEFKQAPGPAAAKSPGQLMLGQLIHPSAVF